MQVDFCKYQGTGNDFVMIDARIISFPEKTSFISKLCHRRFGIGADGLILIKKDANSDFFMKYFNADGTEGSMCGNGARCAVAFSKKLGVVSENYTCFNTVDGKHYALIKEDQISLKMKDVFTIESHPEHIFVNTGSPHHVIFTENIDQIDVTREGGAIRYGAPYFDEGANVNFVKLLDDESLGIRTYERGVEDETLSCGTGVTAAALAAYRLGRIKTNAIKVYSLGGVLSVNFQETQGAFKEIWLHGGASYVFQGVVNLI
nr:diaminopimelate epimerase [Bacteroidetes bacterium endosymbiont of Geopemphigus sp.]